jgi:chromate reductase, NAD(P)H dehydrogenase (quinone)
MMSSFGCSNYAWKPSGIVTYSNGPFAGQRVHTALRPFLGELGCLPVSKGVGLPLATDMFSEDGTPKDPENRMLHQLPSMLDQLEWMAIAMKNQREVAGTP